MALMRGLSCWVQTHAKVFLLFGQASNATTALARLQEHRIGGSCLQPWDGWRATIAGCRIGTMDEHYLAGPAWTTQVAMANDS